VIGAGGDPDVATIEATAAIAAPRIALRSIAQHSMA
jgi:hypothetical protein